MEKDEKPFPVEGFSSDFEPIPIVSNAIENVPVFKLPIGLHAFSLFLIANYYDGNATSFFEHFLRMNRFTDQESIDFTNILTSIASYISPDTNSLFSRLYDRKCNFIAMFKLKSIGTERYSVRVIPRYSELGLIEILRNCSDFGKRHVFIMNPASGAPPSAVNVSAGQPFLTNALIEKEFSTVDSITAKKDSIKPTFDLLRIGQFQIDWAITSQNGCFSLVLCRPPHFIQISDGTSCILSKPFDGAKVHMACYRYSAFIENRTWTARDGKLIHAPFIKGDEIWCSIVKEKMEKWKNVHCSFPQYVFKCVHHPAFYLVNAGYSGEVAAAACLFIDCCDNLDAARSICNEFILQGTEYETVKAALGEYNRFCYWMRSVIRVLKAIVQGDIDRIQICLYALFKCLPAKNQWLVSNSLLLCTEALRIFHPQRGKNETFYASILQIFRFVLGDNFAGILGIQRFDVPKGLRGQIVSVETCMKLFVSRPFKHHVQCVLPVLVRFMKYLDAAESKRGLCLSDELPSFELSTTFLEFLRLQKFDECIQS